jgi:hypothetical protein
MDQDASTPVAAGSDYIAPGFRNIGSGLPTTTVKLFEGLPRVDYFALEPDLGVQAADEQLRVDLGAVGSVLHRSIHFQFPTYQGGPPRSISARPTEERCPEDGVGSVAKMQ